MNGRRNTTNDTEHEGLDEWFSEYENGVNHMLWPSQSLDINLNEHLWEISQRVLDSDPMTHKNGTEYIIYRPISGLVQVL